MAIIKNQAQLSYNNQITNSNLAFGRVLDSLTITKTAVNKHYAVGNSTVYIITLVNNEDTALWGLTLQDNLGEYKYAYKTLYPLTYTKKTLRYYVNGELQATPTVTKTQPLEITGIKIPANSYVTLIYEAVSNKFAPQAQNSKIVNTATLTITGKQSKTITAKETICVESEPRLTIYKTISPVPVTETGTLTYTFLIQNSGNTAAGKDANIVISDTFNPELDDLKVFFNGSELINNTDYTYVNGLFTTTTDKLNVPKATYIQDKASGAWVTNPGTSTLTIQGRIKHSSYVTAFDCQDAEEKYDNCDNE